MINNIALMYPCEYCHVSAQQWCLAPSKRKAGKLHGVRLQPARKAYAKGWEAAMKVKRQMIGVALKDARAGEVVPIRISGQIWGTGARESVVQA